MADLTRRGVLVSSGLIAASAATAGVIAAFFRDGDAELGNRVTARRMGGPVPVDDPAAAAWDDADAVRVPLQPQRLVTPLAAITGTASLLEVEALHDGNALALRLTWGDDDGDDLGSIDRFADAVAVQLPARTGPTPPVTMGGAGAPVHVLQWRAAWQRDLAGHAGATELYPNLVRDVQPSDLLPAEVAALWKPGLTVGNPISAIERASAVEELVAEGFGTLTALAEQRARGSGIWEDGRWRVALGLPLDRLPVADPLSPGSSWPIAFARWAGSRGQRGSRKDFTDWVTLDLRA